MTEQHDAVEVTQDDIGLATTAPHSRTPAMTNPIRVATAALSGRIFAGRPTKDGTGFKEPRYDVTSDVLVAVKDKIGIGHQVNVERNGIVEFRIAILPPEDTRNDADA